ncbi:hypothetical protein [Methanogenium cariaci]|uniref:hypothetical protein n=1 Tax=Methanogenium cariaci TaxID=2197 RepID=UPI0012F682C4|nr:hypothetical protein [Methanogenium cariaci]
MKTFEPIPENLSRQTTNLKAHGASNKQAYKGINDYLNTNAETGKAYFPNTKAEYEAVLPEGGNIVEFKGSQFYTKVRGGRRVPIYEFEAIGKTKSGGIKDSGLRRFSSKKGSSGSEVFEPAPYISGFNTLSSTIASSCSSFHYPERSLAAFLSEIGSSKTGSSETGSSKTGSSKTGSSKTGSSKTGSSETGSSETGSSETGSSETGSSETGSSEISYGNSYSAFISRGGIGKHPSKIRLQQRQKAKAIKMMTKKTKKDWYVKNPRTICYFWKTTKTEDKNPKNPRQSNYQG